MVFKNFEPDQAFAKVCIYGLQGSGKTHSATIFAIGLHKLLTERGIQGGGDTPVFMMDTEGGASWVYHMFKKEGINLQIERGLAAGDIKPAIEHVAERNGILLIDSITAFKDEFDAAYLKRKGKKRLSLYDYQPKKEIERKLFTYPYINSSAHVICCGRLGYEYAEYEDDDGKKAQYKSGVKCKTFTDSEYDSSLCICMERCQEVDSSGNVEGIYRQAVITKAKGEAAAIDGKAIRNPVFKDFLPYVRSLNLGGPHLGVDVSRNSQSVIPGDGKDYRKEQADIKVALDKIRSTIESIHPSSSNADKEGKRNLLKEHFHTLSWEEVKTMPLLDLNKGLEALEALAEGKPVPDDETPF